METPQCYKKHSEHVLEIVKDLRSTQAMDGRRHRCAACAYDKGFADGLERGRTERTAKVTGSS